MKRHLALILSPILSLSLFGCQGGPQHRPSIAIKDISDTKVLVTAQWQWGGLVFKNDLSTLNYDVLAEAVDGCDLYNKFPRYLSQEEMHLPSGRIIHNYLFACLAAPPPTVGGIKYPQDLRGSDNSNEGDQK